VPDLWELDNFDKFIEARKPLIEEKLKICSLTGMDGVRES